MNSRNSPETRYAVCSPMSTAWSPIRSRQREIEEHAQAPLVRGRIAGEVEDALDGAAVDPVDQLVELDERGRRVDVALRERVIATRIISSQRSPISSSPLDQRAAARAARPRA